MQMAERQTAELKGSDEGSHAKTCAENLNQKRASEPTAKVLFQERVDENRSAVCTSDVEWCLFTSGGESIQIYNFITSKSPVLK